MKRIGTGLAIVVAVVCRAVALTILWRWFVVPLGAPPLPIAIAGGLLTTLFLLAPNRSSDDSERPNWLASVRSSLVGTAISLAFGAVWAIAAGTL